MHRFGAIARAACLLLPLWAGAAVAAEAAWQRISEEGRRAISPAMAVGPDGGINVVWLDKGLAADRPAPKPRQPGEHSHRSATNLYFSRSMDGGRTWSKPVRVNAEDGAVWGFAVSKPRIAVGGNGTIHVFYPANETSAVTGLDVVTAQYTRSTDSGRSFAAPITVNRPADFDKRDLLGEGLAATYSFGTMGVAPDGTVVTLWQDIGGMADNADGASAHMAVSRDDGVTFEPEQVAIAGSAVCPCCQLTVAFGEAQTFVGYRKLYDDGRDSTVAIAGSGGQAFTAESRLPFARWDIDGCPLKPTALAVDGERVYAAAFTGGEEPAGVYFSLSSDAGKTFTGRRALHPGAAYSDAPELAVDGDGVLTAVWQGSTGGPRRLFLAQSLDGGETLSAPAELATPPGNSAYPATAAGGDGKLYVAWQQDGEEVFFSAVPVGAQPAARR